MLSEFPSKGYSGKKKVFNNSDKIGFYTDSGKTVLLSQLTLTVEERSNPIQRRLIITSGRRRHAEEAFIEEAKKVLTNIKRYNIEELEIDMLVSYSPCFKCRQELEHFLTNLVLRQNLKVHLTLKIGSLYKDGFKKEEAEKKLAFWINDLEVQGMTVCLKAITVVSELPKTAITDKKRKARDEADHKIVEHIKNINQHYQDVKTLIKSLSKKERKTFFKDGDPIVLGELTVSAFVDQHRVPTTVIKLTKSKRDSQSCPEKKIIAETRRQLPKCWSSIRKSLLLVSTHMPSIESQDIIKRFLSEKMVTGIKNKLFLFLANLHPKGTPSTTSFVEWIKDLEDLNRCLHTATTWNKSTTHSVQDTQRTATGVFIFRQLRGVE